MRPLCRVAVVTLAVLAAAACPAGADDYDWNGVGDVVVSPDGAHAYAAGQTTLGLRIDQASGAPTLISNREPGGLQAAAAISPDGRFVYVGRGNDVSRGRIHIFERDPVSGFLTHQLTFRGEPPNGAPFGAISALEMSPDGRQLYVGQRAEDAVLVLSRDAATGVLRYDHGVFRGSNGLQSGALDIALSPDGRNLYATGTTGASPAAVTVLARDTGSGRLRVLEGVQGFSPALAVAVSPDGRRVYSGMSDYTVWDRNPATGTLTRLSESNLAGGDACGPCGDGTAITVSPDSRFVFSVDPLENTLLEAQSTDSGVAPSRRYTDGVAGNRGLAHPVGLAWTPDGRFLYVAAAQYVWRQNGDWVSGGRGNNGTVAAYRYGGGGLELAGALGPGMGPWPWVRGAPPPASITINDGALYTNDPEVELSITAPQGVASLRLSNDGDFGAPPIRLTDDGRYRWRLADTAPERAVDRVYVRFTDPGWDGGPPLQDLTDDIILDQRPPAVLRAVLRGPRLSLRARDNRSGLRWLQVTSKRTSPGPQLRFRRRVRLRRSQAKRRLYTRVVDGAGNASRWRAVKRR